MSAISKVGRSVNDMTSFMRDKVKSNLVSDNNNRGLGLSEGQVERVLNSIDLSFDQSFSLGFSGVERTLETVLKEVRDETEKSLSSSKKTRSSYKK
tara:strand:+ start:240 stop:527 length:288 start_codon:yes stop_codon:yes gene_type:complete